MPSYKIDSRASKLVVTAKSSVHDTDTEWRGITGTISVEPDKLASIAGGVQVDMTTADAGDWLKNRKLRKDMNFAEHPLATMEIERLEDVEQDGVRVSATLHGTLHWRGKSVALVVTGKGTLDQRELRARGSFQIDVTTLGITPPKVLMIKVEDVVHCSVEVVALAS